MQKVLEDMFGASAMGILGFALMIVMFMPKLVNWYKTRRAKKKEAEQAEFRVLGQRRIQLEKTAESENEDDHTDHGEALAVMHTDNRSIWIQFLCWVMPVAIVLCLIYFFKQEYFMLVAILAVIPLLIGGNLLKHLGSRIVFYRTGFAGTLCGSKVTVDYNNIYAVDVRKALLPFMTPSYILKLEGNKLVVLDGSFFKEDPKIFLDAMEERVKSSAARESMHQF